MNLYLESSTIVLRYTEEPGSVQARALFAGDAWYTTSALTYAEVLAGLHRAIPEFLAPDEAIAVRVAFAEEWSSWLRAPVSREILERAGQLAWDHELRGSDAVHLASALWAQARSDDAFMVATFTPEVWRVCPLLELPRWPEDLLLFLEA